METGSESVDKAPDVAEGETGIQTDLGRGNAGMSTEEAMETSSQSANSLTTADDSRPFFNLSTRTPSPALATATSNAANPICSQQGNLGILVGALGPNPSVGVTSSVEEDEEDEDTPVKTKTRPRGRRRLAVLSPRKPVKPTGKDIPVGNKDRMPLLPPEYITNAGGYLLQSRIEVLDNALNRAYAKVRSVGNVRGLLWSLTRMAYLMYPDMINWNLPNSFNGTEPAALLSRCHVGFRQILNMLVADLQLVNRFTSAEVLVILKRMVSNAQRARSTWKGRGKKVPSNYRPLTMAATDADAMNV